MKSKLFLMLSGVVSAGVVALAPALAFAGGEPAGFSWLVGIPGVQGGGFNQYINALYALAISLAALIAVLKIVIAGAKYMMDDIVTHKSEAKKDIYNALIGLLIVIGAVIILNTINTDLTNVQVDATPATVDDDPSNFDSSRYIENVAEMANEAVNRNTEMITDSCDGDLFNPLTYIPVAGDFLASCASECRRLNGIMNYDGVNSCTYLRDDAEQCNPQISEICCSYIKGGTWNGAGTNDPCGGLQAAEEIRIRQCYSGGNGTWDAAAGTCRTTDCNPNTSSQCCELGFGGSLEGGRCVTGTSELDCQNLGRVWDPATNTCAPGTVSTDETSCQARGAGFVWRAGSCIEYTNTIVVPDTFCTPPDPTCATFCIGTGGDYIPETNSCGVRR